MSRRQEMQRIIHHYRRVTGSTEVDMHEVALWAVKRGMALPKPIEPLDRLAKEFSQAAREEIRYDDSTGKPYRANHAIAETRDGRQLVLWVDIDEAPRRHMQKSLNQRREQMVGDAVQLTLDAAHWNRIHPEESPIQTELDFTYDVQWRLNTPEEKTG